MISDHIISKKSPWDQVPFLRPSQVGVAAGIVGAGGNVGAVIWSTMFKVIPPAPSLFTRSRSYLARFFPLFLVFCAFSPPGRDGSNEPQAGTQGQETAGKGTKSGELRPSFDTPGAVGRINGCHLSSTIANSFFAK